MSTPDENFTYKDFILPEQLKNLQDNENRESTIPIIFTLGTLADLFNMSADDLTLDIQARKQIKEGDMQKAPVHESMKKRLLSTPENKFYSGTLLTSFCLLGISSRTGRSIRFEASGVDGDGKRIGKGFSAGMPPAFFEKFESDPLTGAQCYFGQICEELGFPERVMVYHIFTPTLH
ncbi:MAG: hypothetical protein KA155_00690 [Alphaproteobacteria bacterium]|jgi:hypothetical protein|nr:hypothetical protein [Alphaproteobacteria bacterium]